MGYAWLPPQIPLVGKMGAKSRTPQLRGCELKAWDRAGVLSQGCGDCSLHDCVAPACRLDKLAGCIRHPPSEVALFEAVCVTRTEGAEFPTDRCHGITEGIFRCECCGQELFNATAKCDSGTGWPSFTTALPGATCRPGDPEVDTEVVCSSCGAHLGDYFKDAGPAQGCVLSTGAPSRFCIDGICLAPPPNSLGWKDGCEIKNATIARL
mmetsp:Transcript_33007/g.75490  ORF Transcript_33007/g.75490 Transcript_33007/m.75490 type:complete len:209 (+) Transcript_33007:354-980(+)